MKEFTLCEKCLLLQSCPKPERRNDIRFLLQRVRDDGAAACMSPLAMQGWAMPASRGALRLSMRTRAPWSRLGLPINFNVSLLRAGITRIINLPRNDTDQSRSKQAVDVIEQPARRACAAHDVVTRLILTEEELLAS